MAPPIQFTIDPITIAQMRADPNATLHVLDPLPAIVDQVGGTCGIYALDRALDVRGIAHPPPRKKVMNSEGFLESSRALPDAEKIALFKRFQWPLTSLRQQAKELGVSKVGEILSIQKLHELSVYSGAKDAKVLRLSGATELWETVQSAVKARRAVIIAINGDGLYDAVLDGKDTMAHWITLIGTYEKRDQRRILSTQVGRYDLFPLYRLWRSNDSLCKWRASQFDVIELHQLEEDHRPPKVWKNLIEVGDPEFERLARMQLELHQKNPAEFPVFRRTRKVTFDESELVTTMRHQCLLV